ncbi:hypothetical protein MKZ38_003651 [Zalerion maritima]|uniref:AAA+ ATPase domain-containing protein n=1 Tax=Zalerion maritima TaxID=339359 RepID=A0AAD5RNN5_9PEZI|nr:hypothetical protein MKZ38_003651 [Zalerion maritima]
MDPFANPPKPPTTPSHPSGIRPAQVSNLPKLDSVSRVTGASSVPTIRIDTPEGSKIPELESDDPPELKPHTVPPVPRSVQPPDPEDTPEPVDLDPLQLDLGPSIVPPHPTENGQFLSPMDPPKPDSQHNVAERALGLVVHTDRSGDVKTTETDAVARRKANLDPSSILHHPIKDDQLPSVTDLPKPDPPQEVSGPASTLSVQLGVDKGSHPKSPEQDNVDLSRLNLEAFAVPSNTQAPPLANLPKLKLASCGNGSVLAPSIKIGAGKEDGSNSESRENAHPELESAVFSRAATSKPNTDGVHDQLRSLPGSPTLRPVPHDRCPARSAPSPPKLGGPAENDWSLGKGVYKETSEVMDELMRFEGLEDVKQKFLHIKYRVNICRLQGVDLKTEGFNIVFQANPGTGKTTIARLYAKFLHSGKVLESDEFQEYSGLGLAMKANAQITEILNTMRSKGGVLFIDEAYQLTRSVAGKQVLELLLTEMENKIGKLAMISVGYKDEMEFADFTDRELWNIVCSYINNRCNNKMQVANGMDGQYMRIAIHRLAQGRGRRGFGNARAVQNMADRMLQIQAARLAGEISPDYHFFTKEDQRVEGDAESGWPRPASSYKKSAVDTITSLVQGVHGEDRCIILVGNEKKVKAMVQNVNASLARRFPIDSPFRFRNFNISELKELMKKKAER